MNSDERPHPVGSSLIPETYRARAPAVAPCRKALFLKQSSLTFGESFEASGSPYVKTVCGCIGKNLIDRSLHSNFCPTWLKDRSRHSSRGSQTRGIGGGGHTSSGFNITDDDVSKLITEEDFLDVVFFSCDVEKTGKVPASALLEHIRDIMLPSHLEGTQEIAELTTLMDPTGKDARIDLLTYRNTMTRWIHILQPDRCVQMDESLELHTARPIQQSTPCSDSKDPIWRQRDESNLSKSLLDPPDITDVSFGSLEAVGGESSRGDMDSAVDLQNKIDDLQFQVKRLMEQNGKLQRQMESTEDNNAQLAAETDELRSQLKSTQQVSQRNTSIREENEELKSLMLSTEEEKKVVQRKCSLLEKERTSLEVKNRNLQDELEQVMLESENIQEKFVTLEADLKEYKRLCDQAESEFEAKNIDFEKKSKKCEDMESTLKELYSFNKALKSEKVELECKVTELKQDLCTYQQGQSPAVAAATCAVPRLYEKCSENGASAESLHSELNELVLADETLPSPLCGTSGATFELPVTVSSPRLDPNSLTERMMREFRLQRDEMQGRIEMLLQRVSVVKENKGGNGFSSDLMTEQLQSDMESLSSTVTNLVEAKKISDVRNAKLTEIIKKLRDTNSYMSRKYEESKKLVEKLSSGEQELEKIRAENESLQLTIQKLKTHINELEIKLSRCKSELLAVKDEAHTLTDTLQTQMEYRDAAEQQLQEIKRTYSELEIKANHNEIFVKRLKSDFLTKEKQLQEERRTSSELKSNLYVSKANHQADMQSILDMLLSDKRKDGKLDTPSQLNDEDDDIEGKDSTQQPSTEVNVEQVQRTLQQRLSDLRSRLTSTKTTESLATSSGVDVEGTGLAAAQRAADAMAESYARPNMFLHLTRGRDEPNNNEDKLSRQRSSSLTTRKKSPRLERRHSEELNTSRSYLTSKGSDGKLIDLVNDKLEEVRMSPEDQRFSKQLLVDARQASERFKNRRGRKWSSEESSISSNGDRSPNHSGGSSPRDRSPSRERRSSSETSTSSSSHTNGHLPLEGSLEALKSTPLELINQKNNDLQEKEGISDSGEHVEERTGAEGESDTEDNKSPSCTSQNRPRSDSDVEDIKADILRNIGPLQTEGGVNRSKEPLAKKREEQKLKRNVSFKMPQLSEAQEVNGPKETDTTTITSDSITQDCNISAKQSPRENAAAETSSPRLRKQNEVEIDSPPRLLPNSFLQALGLAPKQSKEDKIMSEQEIEDKYNALASALKLDKHTLAKRVELMQHQRDQSEETIQEELSAIQQCLVTLESQCESNPTSKDCVARLQKQADDLRNMSVWLAGRAEGLGAVQEEGRLSDAAEIMVSHVENLRRLFEREHAELEEARKLLQENRAFLRGSVSPGSPLSSLDEQDSRLFNRRAFSITPGSKKGSLKRKIGTFDMSGSERHEELTSRRRASVAVLGLTGAQLAGSTSHSTPQSVRFGGPHIRTSSAPSANKFSAVVRSARFVQQAAGSFTGGGRRTSMQLSGSFNLDDFKEGKSRWSLVASKARWGSTLSASKPTSTEEASSRTSSTEGDDSPAPSPGSLSANASFQTSPSNTPRSGSIKADDTEMPKPISPSQKTMSEEKSAEAKTKHEEEIYQQGYEQGVRSKVSDELSGLREQQKDFCENLEKLMENAAEEEEQDEKEQQEKESNAQRYFLRWPILHNVHQRKILRLGFAIFIFLIVILSILLQNLPMNICGPGKPVRDSPIYTLCEILLPFSKLRHDAPPLV